MHLRYPGLRSIEEVSGSSAVDSHVAPVEPPNAAQRICIEADKILPLTDAARRCIVENVQKHRLALSIESFQLINIAESVPYIMRLTSVIDYFDHCSLPLSVIFDEIAQYSANCFQRYRKLSTGRAKCDCRATGASQFRLKRLIP